MRRTLTEIGKKELEAEMVEAESECSELERRPNANAARNTRNPQIHPLDASIMANLSTPSDNGMAEAATNISFPAGKPAESMN
jgi:hypothetical protein